jgi:outer membrane protein assembly factor BamB
MQARKVTGAGARSVVLVALATACGSATAYDWLQFNGDAAHSGNNTLEAALDRNSVASLALKYQVALPAVADGAPVLLQGVATASGIRDLLFVTTKAGHIVALDAATGATVWTRQYPAGECRINNGDTACYTTSSPAIDPDRRYVYSYGLDGYVHKLLAGDGTEIVTDGWPELATLKGYDEKGSSALAIATANGSTYLYVMHGGYPGDNGDYQGHVTAIDLATGAQKVFNAMCSDQAVHFASAPASPSCAGVRSAVWARPGVVYDAPTNRIYLATGNGAYSGNAGGHDWSETVIALAPDGSGAGAAPLDSYTPVEFSSLDATDADLGSVAPVIFPSPKGSTIAHPALQTGKDGRLRLIDLANLSGQGSAGNLGGELGAVLDVPQGGNVLPQPAVWTNPADGSIWIFVANANGLSGLELGVDSDNAPSLAVHWQSNADGSSPIVANGVLYYAASNALRALDPSSGDVLWSTNRIGGIHWQSPVVANGAVYVTDEAGQLTAFALPATSTSTAVVEFYDASLDHYFITSLQNEITALDSGAVPGWTRTGETFNAYARSVTDANPVCRFYLPPPYGNSHFYSGSPDECAIVLAKYPFFDYESPAVFYIPLPDPATGACLAGATPVYRLWDDRADTNHRYTTSRTIRDQMVAAGWIPEGYGPDAVIMCAPQ